MPTLTDRDLPALVYSQKTGPSGELFHADFLTDRSNRTITFGAKDTNLTNEYMHVYLEDGIFVSVRYVVNAGRSTLLSHTFGALMKAEDLIPEVLIITATDREFTYKFIEECGSGFFESFDPIRLPKLPDSETYQAPTLETLQKLNEI